MARACIRLPFGDVSAPSRFAGNRLNSADALLVVDSFEVVKPYAQRMLYLAPAARDKPAAPTEHAQRVSAWDDIVFAPVAQTLWSTQAPGSLSPTAEIVRLIRTVSAACGGRGAFNINAVEDSSLPGALVDETYNDVVRIAPEQPLVHRRRRTDAVGVGRACTKPYATTIYKTQEDHEESDFDDVRVLSYQRLRRPLRSSGPFGRESSCRKRSSSSRSPKPPHSGSTRTQPRMSKTPDVPPPRHEPLSSPRHAAHKPVHGGCP